MVKFVEDGKERYVAANRREMNKRYALRVTEIKDVYVISVEGKILKRCTQRVLMLRELARVKREIYGKDNFYLMPL